MSVIPRLLRWEHCRLAAGHRFRTFCLAYSKQSLDFIQIKSQLTGIALIILLQTFSFAALKTSSESKLGANGIYDQFYVVDLQLYITPIFISLITILDRNLVTLSGHWQKVKSNWTLLKTSTRTKSIKISLKFDIDNSV